MSDLAEFGKHIEEQLAKANREPSWVADEVAKYMELASERRQQFDKLASHLIKNVIRPRLELLASQFPNAVPTRNEPPGYCAYWFGYCERFPVSTEVAFIVEYDVRLENVSIAYEAHMMPTFIKFDEYDKLTVPLDHVEDGLVADWVERRLLEFLDAYMRVDRGGEDFEVDVVTDPVCGMRIRRSSAVASEEHSGHAYYFCSKDCQVKFAQHPTAYVRVKGM